MPENLYPMLPSSDNLQLAQAIAIPDLSALPEMAQGFVYAIIAFSVGITIVVPAFGFFKGKSHNTPTASSGAVAAAVIVDPAALNALTTQASVLNDKLDKLTATIAATNVQMEITRAVRREEHR